LPWTWRRRSAHKRPRMKSRSQALRKRACSRRKMSMPIGIHLGLMFMPGRGLQQCSRVAQRCRKLERIALMGSPSMKCKPTLTVCRPLTLSK
jgi:hypothetical protein